MQTETMLHKAQEALRVDNAEYARLLAEQVIRAEPNNAAAIETFFRAIDSAWAQSTQAPPQRRWLATLRISFLAVLARWRSRHTRSRH